MRALVVLLAAATVTWAQPAPIDSDKVLSGFLDQMRETLERQPNYTCLETVERTRRYSGGNTLVEDTLRLEVALVENKEMFAWPGSREFEDKELTELVSTGMFGNGNFALFPRILFGPNAPPFVYSGEADVNGRRTAQFNFRVARLSSGYQISRNRRKATVGYHGSFWVDPESLDLKRLLIVPDLIPPELEIIESEDRVDYARVRIGEDRFLMPVESNLMISSAEGVSRNRVRFRGCRKFTGESTLVFVDEDLAEADTPAAAAVKEVVLPVGTELYLTLTTEIVLAEGVVGDIISAKVNSNVKTGKDTLIPKGAVAQGRIVKLERQPETFVLALHFTDVEWRGGHARLNVGFVDLGGVLPTGGPTQVFPGSNASDIVVLRDGPKRLKDLTMRWRVAP